MSLLLSSLVAAYLRAYVSFAEDFARLACAGRAPFWMLHD